VRHMLGKSRNRRARVCHPGVRSPLSRCVHSNVAPAAGEAVSVPVVPITGSAAPKAVISVGHHDNSVSGRGMSRVRAGHDLHRDQLRFADGPPEFGTALPDFVALPEKRACFYHWRRRISHAIV
jgi:hypothetical protein